MLKRGGPTYSFYLEGDNSLIIGNSDSYTKLASARKGVASIYHIAGNCEIEDQTVEGTKPKRNPKFEIYKDGNKKLRFRMRAKNGQVVLTSVPFKEMDALMKTINEIKKIGEETCKTKEVWH